MKQYVLIDKTTGRYFPDTSELQEADVFVREAFTLPNSALKELEVNVISKLELSSTRANIHTYVRINNKTGRYVADDNATTLYICDAEIYTKAVSISDTAHTWLPVIVKKQIVIV